MPKCSYCNSTIIIGGVRDGEHRFCNKKCRQEGALLSVAQQVPSEEVQKRTLAVHQGPCPKCQRGGPVDVHTAHSVLSALVVTTWKSSPQVSCESCGKKAKITAAVSSFFLGWWGFPWGLILTPVQVTRNLWGLARGQPSLAPSAQLERIVRLGMAAELRRAQNAGSIPPPPRAS
jgi:hypothetical protein